MEEKILKLLVIVLGFMTILFAGLAVYFVFNLKDVKNSIKIANNNADIVGAIKSLKVLNGKDGQDGMSIIGPPGKDGKDSTSTVIIEQQPIKGDKGEKGDKGDSALPAPQIEFDGHGNWHYKGDEVWYPLNQPVVAE